MEFVLNNVVSDGLVVRAKTHALIVTTTQSDREIKREAELVNVRLNCLSTIKAD